jgi:3-oxoadipate enol-lactonase
MGGMIGQTFALQYPGAFKSLTLAEEKAMAPLLQPTLERWFTEPFRKSNPDAVAAIAVICGERDPGTPPAMSREIHDNAPGSKLVMIAQAAHLSNLENPAAFTKAMQEFLATH